MGNRAVVVFDEFKPESEAAAIYLHWNGGRDSIEGYLKATRILMGGRLGDGAYARARFFQVIGIFMGGLCGQGDNGVFIIDSDTMTIKGRGEWDAEWEEQDEYDVNTFANEIIKRINAVYAVNDVDAGEYSKLGALPTAEEYDAEQAAK